MPSRSQIVAAFDVAVSSGLPSFAPRFEQHQGECCMRKQGLQNRGQRRHGLLDKRTEEDDFVCTSPPPWFDEPAAGRVPGRSPTLWRHFFLANTLADGTEEFVSTDALFNTASAFLSDNEVSDSILAFFYDNGFLDVKIGEPQIGPDDQVTIAIEEGPRYRVGSIAIQGETVFSRSELESRLKMKPGAPFRGSGLQIDVLALSDFYSDRGYAWVDVDPRTRIVSTRHLVDDCFDITPGEQVRIGRITISGNATTHADVIRRALKIHEHQLLQYESNSRIEGSTRRTWRF